MANRAITGSQNEQYRIKFVDGLDLSGVVHTGLVKKFHRKSRFGCSTCRVRRVKMRASVKRQIPRPNTV